MQNEIDGINSTRLEKLGQIKAHNSLIKDLDTAIRLVKDTATTTPLEEGE